MVTDGKKMISAWVDVGGEMTVVGIHARLLFSSPASSAERVEEGIQYLGFVRGVSFSSGERERGDGDVKGASLVAVVDVGLVVVAVICFFLFVVMLLVVEADFFACGCNDEKSNKP